MQQLRLPQSFVCGLELHVCSLFFAVHPSEKLLVYICVDEGLQVVKSNCACSPPQTLAVFASLSPLPHRHFIGKLDDTITKLAGLMCAAPSGTPATTVVVAVSALDTSTLHDIMRESSAMRVEVPLPLLREEDVESIVDEAVREFGRCPHWQTTWRTCPALRQIISAVGGLPRAVQVLRAVLAGWKYGESSC